MPEPLAPPGSLTRVIADDPLRFRGCRITSRPVLSSRTLGTYRPHSDGSIRTSGDVPGANWRLTPSPEGLCDSLVWRTKVPVITDAEPVGARSPLSRHQELVAGSVSGRRAVLGVAGLARGSLALEDL